MCEFTNLERCAAYVAAQAALAAVQRVSGAWPADLADHTQRAALDAVNVTAVAITHDLGSADRRSCLRDAIIRAIHVAGFIDAAGAMGFGAARLDDVRRVAGRSIALLSMLLHASTSLPATASPDSARRSRTPASASDTRAARAARGTDGSPPTTSLRPSRARG
jgi:hypothetical protein